MYKAGGEGQGRSPKVPPPLQCPCALRPPPLLKGSRSFFFFLFRFRVQAPQHPIVETLAFSALRAIESCPPYLSRVPPAAVACAQVCALWPRKRARLDERVNIFRLGLEAVGAESAIFLSFLHFRLLRLLTHTMQH